MRVLVVLAMVASMIVTAGAAVDVQSSGDPYVPNEVIVGLEAGGDVESVAVSLGGRVDRAIVGGNAFVLTVGTPIAAAVLARSLPGVRYAEPNFVRTLHDHPTDLQTPNDTDFHLKWDLYNDGTLSDGSDTPTHGADIDFLVAYDQLAGATLAGTVVAVLDTGIDAAHPDLNDKLVPGFDFISNDGTPQDGFGHGTHVAGIAAAETNNATGTAGVGFHSAVEIMPIKVCDDNGSCPSDAIANGIRYAANNGAKVVNLSLGGSSISQTEVDAINHADSMGVLIVASAGNSNVSTKNYPAAQEPVMAVSATDWDDQKASYSNFGADWVDIAAPGGDMGRYDDPEGIYSTMPTYNVYLTSCRAMGLLSPCYDQNYDQLAGTSMAAPQVAGAAALLYAMGVGSGATADQEVRTVLAATVDALSDSRLGAGRLNVGTAVTSVSVEPALSIEITQPQPGTVTGEVVVTAAVSNATSPVVELVVDDGSGYSQSLAVTDNGDGTYSGTWSTAAGSPPDDAYTITASVTDGTDQATDSVLVELDNVDEPPTVVVTSPADGSSVSGVVELAAAATDDRGVDTVEFRVIGNGYDSGPIAAADADGDGTWTANWDSTGLTGEFTITATATDTGSQTVSGSIAVTVEPAPSILLSVNAYKLRGIKYADLTWSGATSANVDVYRDGALVGTTANDGAHTHNSGERGGGTHVYQVCEAGTSTCSNEVTVSY